MTPLPTGSYRVTIFTNAIPSLQKVIRIGLPVQLVGVVSRKTHGSAGTFDVDLPLTGNPGIECRSGGANGDYEMIFTFSNPLSSVGGATVSSGTGSVSTSEMGPNPNQYTVNLTGVSSGQYITVTLNSVVDEAGNSSNVLGPQMGVLVGDVNFNGTTNNTDVGLVKGQVTVPVDETNFRNDLNASGTVNNTDVAITKAQVSAQLPQLP